MINKNMCCGCSACSNICPRNCIKMKSDKEGFLYPETDESVCVKCGLCKKVCPALNHNPPAHDVHAYACKNNDTDIQKNSSSGGAFSAFAEYVLEQNGVVFGAIFDENFRVVHGYAENKYELEKMRGSKYVQSDIACSYKNAQQFLESGRLVLFSGTSCQVAGLHSYLRKHYDNLICIDVICHGVPSPLVFKKYIDEMEQKYESNAENIKFRDKTEGWGNFSMKIDFHKKHYRQTVDKDIYLRGFVQNLYLRPSCYSCRYKGLTAKSDISLADFWGIKNILPDFYDENGVSLVLLNTKAGKNLFEKIKNTIEYSPSSLEHAELCNHAITEPPKPNKRRKKFWGNLKNKNVISLIDKNLKSNFINKLNITVFKLVKKIKK